MLLIDTRLSGNSGIGRYIDSLLNAFNELSFDRYRCINFPYKPYSFTGQINSYKLPKDFIYWTPHWNHPYFSTPGKNNVITVHDVLPLRFPDIYSRIDRYVFHRFIQKAVKRKYQIITVSEFSRKEILSYFPEAKVKVLHNGATRFKDTPSSQNPRFTEPFLLCVGNLKPHKNLVFLIKAFQQALAWQLIPDNTRLIVCGAFANLRIKDNEFIQSIGTNEKDGIFFFDAPTDKELAGLYHHCTGFVSPSLYEGFGLPILEAMQFGRKIACSNIESHIEIAGDQVLYFDPTDIEDCAYKLGQLFCSSANIYNYDKILNRFTWINSAKAHMSFFKQIDPDL